MCGHQQSYRYGMLPKWFSDAEAGVPPAAGRNLAQELGGSAASRTVDGAILDQSLDYGLDTEDK
ncbi:MAG: hypothetical protein QGH15_00830 [Kiritimatiellia bacterium]|jgi:hypothetical protein|nr:hypothetical protein [Kiritimatiellia bacterium]